MIWSSIGWERSTPDISIPKPGRGVVAIYMATPSDINLPATCYKPRATSHDTLYQLRKIGGACNNRVQHVHNRQRSDKPDNDSEAGKPY